MRNVSEFDFHKENLNGNRVFGENEQESLQGLAAKISLYNYPETHKVRKGREYNMRPRGLKTNTVCLIYYSAVKGRNLVRVLALFSPNVRR